MKKIFSSLCFVLCFSSIFCCPLFSQDTIIKTNGAKLSVYILDVSTDTVYFRFTNRNYNTDEIKFTIPIKEVKEIKYKKGGTAQFGNMAYNKTSKISGNSKGYNIIKEKEDVYRYFGIGYGSTYSGLGILGAYRTKWYGYSASIGLFVKPLSLTPVFMYNFGPRIYIIDGLYVHLSYGRVGWEERIEYNDISSTTTDHALNGSSFLLGYEKMLLGDFGLNFAFGTTVFYNSDMFEGPQIAFDIGVLYYFEY
jgi:hypothetical protein